MKLDETIVVWTGRLLNRGLTLTAVKFLHLVHQLNHRRRKFEKIDDAKKSKITDYQAPKKSFKPIIKPIFRHFKPKPIHFSFNITILHQFWAILWAEKNLDWPIWDPLYFQPHRLLVYKPLDMKLLEKVTVFRVQNQVLYVDQVLVNQFEVV